VSRVLRSRTLLLAPLLVAVAVAIVTLVGGGSTGGAAPADGVDGAELFETQCSSCHGLDGRGVEGRGPTLEPEGEASTDFVLRTGRMPLAAPDLQADRGPVRYSEAEILALVDYVGSIGSGPDIPEVELDGADVANGGELFRLNCAACHVASGAGAPIGGGRVAPNVLRATPTELVEAIIVGPGSMPVFSELEPDELNDIAAYVQTALVEDDTTSATRFGGAGPVAEGLAAWLLVLLPLVALTRWIGRPKDGRDHPVSDGGGTRDEGDLLVDAGLDELGTER
jgi:ubiquinol-cytochrome c reductase cytochrome c subunit